MAEWVTRTMEALGYWGIGLLMFLENLFPPIPSELIMPLAGFTVAQGKMQFAPAVVAGVVGTVLGAMLWYWVGQVVSERRLMRWADRYGKWLALSGQDIRRAIAWFNRYGKRAVFLGAAGAGGADADFAACGSGPHELCPVPALFHRGDADLDAAADLCRVSAGREL